MSIFDAARINAFSQDQRDTLAILEVDGEAINNIRSFSYNSDVLNLADPFSVEIPDPRGRFKNKLRRGSSVKLKLQNPRVAFGAATLKVTGIIVEAERRSTDGSGVVVLIRGADLGWHLVNNDAPEWFNLRGISFLRLLEACIFPERVFRDYTKSTGWGFAGFRAENDTNRRIRQNARLIANLTQQANTLSPLMRIQAEPGQPLADLLVTYARREGYLVNVSADGYLQIFRPRDNQPAVYSIEYHPIESPESVKNNVISATTREACNGVYTDVVCVGEVVWLNTAQSALAKDNPNVGKFKGKAINTSLLPFTHRKSFTDGERLTREAATRRADWMQKRGLFDSTTYTYEVRGHHQNSVWWEADTTIQINDTVNDVKGIYYVAAVNCSRTEANGDRTTVTVKPTGLLAAG